MCVCVCVFQEGDRIGMMIKTGGELHYYINGLDQGIAATSVPPPVWAVVDLYGMTVKVTTSFIPALIFFFFFY